MRMDKKIFFRSLLVLAMAGVGIVACKQGDTDAGGADTTPGVQFVSDGSAGGRITIELEDDLVVGGTARFLVLVTDPNGSPIPFLDITCDSEQEIAIIEPSTGHEHTSHRGGMSGILGGNMPGSFLLECRGPAGTQLIARKTINITGEVTAGFTGFTGAAGGGLGGGVSDIDDGDDDVDAEQITFNDITFTQVDGTTGQIAVIDLTQIGDCDGDITTVDPELFGEDVYNLSLTNTRTGSIQIESVTFSIPSVVTSFTQLTQIVIAANSTQSALSGPFTYVSGTKNFAGTAVAVSASVANVTFTVTGSNLDGSEPFTITRSAVMTANNYDNCSS